MIYKMSSFDFDTSVLTSLKVILQTKIELFVTSKSPIIYHNNFVKKQKKNPKKNNKTCFLGGYMVKHLNDS